MSAKDVAYYHDYRNQASKRYHHNETEQLIRRLAIALWKPRRATMHQIMAEALIESLKDKAWWLSDEDYVSAVEARVARELESQSPSRDLVPSRSADLGSGISEEK